MTQTPLSGGAGVGIVSVLITDKSYKAIPVNWQLQIHSFYKKWWLAPASAKILSIP